MSGVETSKAFGLFKELSEISLAILSDLRVLREDHVELDMHSPYRIKQEDLEMLCDPGHYMLVRRISNSPRFAWDLGRLVGALESGQRWAISHAHTRRVSKVTPKFETSHRLILMLLMHVRRMAIASSKFAEMAFGLDPAEIRTLIHASDIALIEAAPQVSLTFRSEHFRDVLRIPSHMVNTRAKETVLDVVVAASGLRRQRSW